jgi:hypothetical protein
MASAATASSANEPAIPQAIAAAPAISVVLIIETLHILCFFDVCATPVRRQLEREIAELDKQKRRRVLERGGV